MWFTAFPPPPPTPITLMMQEVADGKSNGIMLFSSDISILFYQLMHSG
jgi:hypothetical protein